MVELLKILVIDDDKVDAMALNRSISKSGILADVVVAFSEKEAIIKLESTEYDLIFLDYMLSETDGISLLKKIRRKGFHTPVIFVTSQGDEKIASQAIISGASDYIPKTLITPDGVSQSIRNVIKISEGNKRSKEVEFALKIIANQLREAQKLAKIGSWELDISDNSIIVSKEFLNILEIDHGDKMSLDFFKSFIPQEDQLLFEKELDLVKSNNVEVKFKHKVIDEYGTVKYVIEHIKYLLDEDGKPNKILGTIQDISEQRLVELELIEAKDLAEESVRVKEQFLYNMSHEIRTPMNSIIGFANILEDSKLTKDQSQSVQAIKTAGDNLLVIINGILDFSKIQANKMTYEKISFSLSDCVHSVIELLKPKALEKKLKLLVDIDSNINDRLIGDPTKLTQILINLIGNATKFTEKGYIEVVVSLLESSKSNLKLKFSVIDTGIGIEPHKIDSIFESFNQASNTTIREYGGTGLGLSITQKLVELQGGIMLVKSELSVGSEFSFIISYEQEGKDNKEGNPSVVSEKGKVTPDFLKSKNILLVEDNDLNQLLVKKIFKKWGKEIDVANNGKIAIQEIQKNDYDIVLMDIDMPEMDGIEATKYIRQNLGEKSNIPIMALTAHATLGEKKKCLDLGMSDYLSKPFDANELLEKIYFNTIETQLDPLKAKVFKSKLLNLEYLNKYAEGDQNFVNEMISLFIKTAPKQLKIILKSNDKNDIDTLEKEVHKLKSSLGLLGVDSALECVSFIEKEIREDPKSGNWKAESIKLNNIIQLVLEELTTFLAKLE